MTVPPNTTLKLRDTVHGEGPSSSWWLLWAGASPPPPTKLEGTLVLGRGAPGSGALNASGVSRRHAEVGREGPLLVARDLGSTNGTFLNGHPLQKSALSAGDVLRLGDAVCVVTRRRDDLGPPRVEEPLDGVLFGPGLNGLFAQVQKLAPGDLPVVIEGATGTGKEGVARSLHQLSKRAGNLQAVNCGALPPGLAESELFGHRKGAFTGAEKDALGHVRAADRGTLFLDELYDLAPQVQTKLLRVLQEKRVLPLGETRPIAVDVRVVAASLVPLEELVATGRLREDLAARLAGVSLAVPTLAERREDISPLLVHFLARYSGGRVPALDSKLLEHLLLRPWRGNVRELELFTRRLLTLHGHEPVLRRAMVDEVLTAARSISPPPASPRRRSGDDDRDDLQKLADAFAKHGNLSRAAQEAGISRQRAYRLLDGQPAQSLLLKRDDET